MKFGKGLRGFGVWPEARTPKIAKVPGGKRRAANPPDKASWAESNYMVIVIPVAKL
jgi:hypothetical protein